MRGCYFEFYMLCGRVNNTFLPIDLDGKKSKLLLWKRRNSTTKLKAGRGILLKMTIKTLRCGFPSTLREFTIVQLVLIIQIPHQKSSFVFTGVNSEQVQQVALNLPSYGGQLISFELYKRQSYFCFP